MRGIYTVDRKDGTSVYINYTPPGEQRIHGASARAGKAH